MDAPYKVKLNHWIPKLLRVNGIVLYPYVLFAKEPSERLMAHEMIHVEQIQRYGVVMFYLRYLWETIRPRGYKFNILEIEARERSEHLRKSNSHK